MKIRTWAGLGFGFSVLLLVVLLWGANRTHPHGAESVSGVNDSPMPREFVQNYLQDWPARTGHDTSSPTASTSAKPAQMALDLRAELRRLGEAFSKQDRETTENLLQKLIHENPGVGDATWGLYRGEPLDRMENKGALILLQVAVSLSRNAHPDGLAAFAEEGSTLLVQWMQIAFPPGGAPEEKALAVLRMPSVLHKEDLRMMESFGAALTSAAQRAAFARLLASFFEVFDKGDLPLLETLLAKPDPLWCRLAAETMLRLDPASAQRISRWIAQLPGDDASALLVALCRYAPAQEIPDLLQRMGNGDPQGTNYSSALLVYLGRAGLNDYERVLHARGSSEDSVPFRKDATIAANMAMRAHHLDQRKGLEFFSAVWREDPSPKVRGPALLALANYWDPNDKDGFQALLDQTLAGGDPIMAQYAKTAEAVFLKIPDPEDEALGEMAKKLSGKK